MSQDEQLTVSNQAIPFKNRAKNILYLVKHNASDIGMHQVLIILTLTFIQGHTDLNHENNICSIISGAFQARPIRTKDLNMFCQLYDLDLDSRSQVRLILDTFLTYSSIVISRTLFKLWHKGRLVHGI